MQKGRSAWKTSNQRYLMAAIHQVQVEIEIQNEGILNPGQKKSMSSDAQIKLDSAAAELSSPSAFETLAKNLGLSIFEQKILLTCAGIELNSGFAALMTAVQGEKSQILPTIGTLLALFPEAHWSALGPDSPLRYWQLVEVIQGQYLTNSRLKIDERILHYLTGIYQPDERLAGLIVPYAKKESLVPSHLQKAEKILKVLDLSNTDGKINVIHITGDEMADNMAVANFSSQEKGLELRVISEFAIPSGPKEIAELSRLWNREAALEKVALFLDCEETDSNDALRVKAITRFCESIDGLLFTGSPNWKPKLTKASAHIEVHKPSSTEQRLLWEKIIESKSLHANGHIGKLVTQFNLSATAIEKIGSSIYTDARESQKNIFDLTEDIIWEKCRIHSRPRLDNLAQHIIPGANWEDLVLPEFQISVLKEIVKHVKYKAQVYENWGFGTKSNRGLGINALFAGESGTGKTMASEVLANELKLDLYRIDLSQVVNKYIGETEKNLKRIFDAAEEGGAILLFDEADALFGKRSDVKDSHDRYANIEVSYLLQRMENYRGLAILTTNMKNALDKAFIRRIRFIVQFPFPDSKQRSEIWKHIFPKETPTQNIDYEKLGRLNIAGGNIRNIAMNAAFIAAEEKSIVQMSHIALAAKNEYAKIEKQMSTGESFL